MVDESLLPLLKNSPKCKGRGGKIAIGIIGTGNYAIAISKRLTMTGYDVIMGSRRPHMRESYLKLFSECLCGVKVTSIGDCLKKCDVIFVAIHMEDFKITLEKFEEETKGKVLIDVSNREYRYAAHSNADHLASVLPNAVVVKAFNSISAYTMEDLATSGGNSRVFVASNDSTARSTVGDIAKSMGFRVVDLGGLKSARYMEDFVLKVFSHWKIPIFLTFGIFNLWSLYVVYICFVEKSEFAWEQIFLKVLNKPLCMTAMTVLALTYLPSHIASFYQIYNGTKHKRFPGYLDTWLKSRKQLGLISLFLVTVHVLASTLMMSPTYYRSWYHTVTVTLPTNTSMTSGLVIPVSTSWIIWKGEASLLVGIFAFVLMAIIGLTSIPSVGESLNWSEWRCIQSKLSYFVLLLSVSHVCIMGAPGWAKGGSLKTIRSITFLSILLPILVLFLKFIFLCPPLKNYIRKIRRGWERTAATNKPTDEDVENMKINKSKERELANQNNKGKMSCCCGDTGVKGTSSCDGCKAGVFSVVVHCECSSL
uniref:Pyrroline-5-carboxylate reductase catalytic N-terminal domain-containing protein n=1 Tax=Arion vulgaris TaxID=1028688 RepID=A0A0B7ANJ9_9EUPU